MLRGLIRTCNGVFRHHLADISKAEFRLVMEQETDIGISGERNFYVLPRVFTGSEVVATVVRIHRVELHAYFDPNELCRVLPGSSAGQTSC